MHDHILQTIGNTPVVRLNRLAPAHVNVFVKLEAFNPMGSVKDRMALATIEAAEASGALRPGQTVIEATSGNTGIGLAMVCAVKGYPLVVTMAESFSIERRKILRFLGARVVLTPAELKGSGMLNKAVELAAAHGWFLVRQFENEANAEVHSRTTAREILRDFSDRPLHYFVTGCGTGGTLKGVSRVLKAESPHTIVVACEPDNAQVLGSGIAQDRNADGSPASSHPAFRPHLMQGWSPDFIARLTEDAIEAGHVDRIVPVDGERALALTRELATREGIFSGVSGGATLAGALEVAAHAPAGSNILAMLPDTGERYLSTPVFDPIPVDMSEAELEISRSTPSARFDKPAAPARPAPVAAAPAHHEVVTDPVAERYFRDAIADPGHPVVLFALAWCEFCWSVRKLFDRLGVPFRAVDLDSVPLQEHDLGGKLRPVLLRETGKPTIPQIFIGGQWVGGATDLFNELASGRLAQRLAAVGIALKPVDPGFNAYSLLPGWLQKR